MALSDDQRAMLRLLAQREPGYEDMSALRGVSVEELRGRVKEVLSELEKEGEEAPQLPPEPEAPEAQPPPPPTPPAPKPAPPAPPVAAEEPELSATPPSGQTPPPSRPKRGISLPSSNGARIGVAAVAAAIVVVVVLLLVLGGGDGSDATTSTTTVNSSEPATDNAVAKVIKSTEGTTGGGRQVTRAVLDGVDGQKEQGVVVFGRLKNKLALYIVAEGLEPPGEGESYVVWIARSPTQMLPLPISPVVEDGKIAERVQVPTELLAFLADGTFDELAITRASVAKLNGALNEATKAKEQVGYTGTPVMRGQITGPIVGAAKRIEAEEKAGK